MFICRDFYAPELKKLFGKRLFLKKSFFEKKSRRLKVVDCARSPPTLVTLHSKQLKNQNQGCKCANENTDEDSSALQLH